MPIRDSASKPSPATGGPSRNDRRNDEPCVFCGEPIGDEATSRVHVASRPGDRTGRVHAKCLHEKGVMAAAMRAPRNG